GLQAAQCLGAGLGTHPAAEDNRVVPGVAKQAGDLFQMAGPVGEYQAVAVFAERGDDVRDDLPGALPVSSQVTVDGGDAAGAGRVGVTAVPVPGRVDVQDRDGTA